MIMEKLRKNTIYLLSDGRLLKAIDTSEEGLACVQFVDRDEPCYLEPTKLDIASWDIGAAARIAFYASRSIHLRLNRMNKV